MIGWNQEVMQDVITSLSNASTQIDEVLSGVKGDITSTLDFNSWHDGARKVYDEQEHAWHKAAGEMHRCLHEGGIPTLKNMSENLDMTEMQNMRAWQGVYDA